MFFIWRKHAKAGDEGVLNPCDMASASERFGGNILCEAWDVSRAKHLGAYRQLWKEWVHHSAEAELISCRELCVRSTADGYVAQVQFSARWQANLWQKIWTHGLLQLNFLQGGNAALLVSMQSKSNETLLLPPSVVGWFDALITLPVILGVFFYLRSHPDISNTLLCVLLVAALGVIMGGIEILRAPWRQRAPEKVSWLVLAQRASVKLLGFFVAMSLIMFLYWLFPEYQRQYYAGFFDALFLVAPWIPLITIPYFVYVEYRLPHERGGAWELGAIALGIWDTIDWNVLGQYLLGWLVKGFFLPIMFGDIANNIGELRTTQWDLLGQGFMPAFNLLFIGFITLELVFVSAGYVFTCRLFDSQIRSVEKTLFGWVIAVMSYSPFLGLFYVRYLDYSVPGSGWTVWLQNYPQLLMLWGTIILVLLVLHLWSDACFGVRFSNLTHRGIITNGPYRFSKHPAYVIKNIRWWMVSVPFIAINWHEALRLSLLLLLVNLIYTLRSYAEERMLSQDPVYVAYARWMERHGVLRWVGYYVPALSYEWRLARWQKAGIVGGTPQER